MLDIKEKRHITVVGRGGASNIDWEDIENKPDFATVATSGSYNDLTDKPEIPGQVNADWDATSGVSQILNKPNLATVATSGSYNDLTDKPTILTQWFGTQAEYDAIETKDPNTIYNIEGGGQVQANWTENDSSDPSYIQNKPTLATVATSGSYSDLSNTPSLATVATSGSYNDLTDKPDLTHYVEDTDLASVATSGSYNDLSDKPDLTHYVEDTDLASVATSGSYNDLSNKPEIPTVPSMAIETLTFTIQGGTTKTIDFYTVPDYFYVENRTNSNGTFTIKKSAAGAPSIQVYSSTDRINWTNMGTTSTSAMTINLPANGKTYLKATANNWSNGTSNYNYFGTSYNYNVGGNIMSLLYGDSFVNKTTFPTNNGYVFSRLFLNNEKIISAENLILPATTVTEYCYSQMFDGCTSLTTAPAILPATTLANNCYSNMFRYCRALTTAPVLPATTLASYCYSGMFSSCSALTTAPALPATTLASYCYSSMFSVCSALTTAPVLPATTLVNYCYQEMFNVCSSLNKITIYANNISATNCLKSWVNGVAATGDFYRLGSASFPSGIKGIPSGWTVHTSL
jgi:hypothetical protein